MAARNLVRFVSPLEPPKQDRFQEHLARSEMVRSQKFNRRVLRTVPALVFLTFVIQGSPSMAAGIFGDNSSCPTARNLADRKDYRLRETTRILRWKANDNYENHVGPALQRMRSGIFSDRVIDDLNFTLVRWPNHYQALQALIAFEAGGGRADRFIPVSCYFQRANWFVPDDANVFVLYGNYQYQSGNNKVAELSWQRALAVDSDSVEAHYNLGLLYFGLGDYSASVDHARVAYGLGYPLPGLKRKLVKVGHWD